MERLVKTAVALWAVGLLVWAQHVGIGTATPGSRLSVSGGLSVGAGYAGTAAPANGAIIQGIVGIATSTPASQLSVSGNLSVGVGYASTLAPTNGAIIQGNVGIGTTNPLSPLSITPTSVGPKITLWDGGSATDHYGFTISPAELDYHSRGRHVFKHGGKASNSGTDLLILEAPGTTGPGWSIHRGGGNTRGLYAVDLQIARGFATDVASGNYATIGGGEGNMASGNYSTVAGG
ncbi:MAG: hypothetical protein KatS3mg026_1450 [Bacteroidia bacterium]|nr:MAG: hypothetical protein KatS3mg026_1450 [Bacteroidia bacterium]